MTRRPSRQFPRRQTDLRAYCTATSVGRLVPLKVWSLGPGGAGFELPRGDVTIGEQVEVAISLPGMPMRLLLGAEVIWSQRIVSEVQGQPGALRFGVRFENGALADFKRLRDFAFEGSGRADEGD